MRALTTTLLVSGLVLLAGCGKRGVPLPPEPRGPYAPEEVEVRQIGDQIRISFELPEPRNRDKPSQQIYRAFLVRVEQAGAGQVPDADSFRRRGDKAGVLLLDGDADARPAFLETIEDAAGPSVPALWYGVRLEDRRGRSSPLVVAGRITPVPPLTTPPRPRAEMTAAGVRLQWDGPGEGPAPPINIYRAVLGGAEGRRPVNATPLTGREYLDAGVVVGTTYSYSLRAALSGEKPYQESLSSDAVRVHAVDLFAPAPPTRPVAVQEGAVVRLFWVSAKEISAIPSAVGKRVTGRSLRPARSRVRPGWTGMSTPVSATRTD